MITVDFSKNVGKIKPMHAVNNGPMKKSVRSVSNFELFRDSGIPFVRTHDSAFCESYGFEFTVDVHRIFTDFDADENDPNSYDFECTDNYIATIIESGSEVFYRLGSNIEHGKKKGTYPPKDYLKWAMICEHIILHYNNGWKDGFNYGIKYWEIWNEPDCKNGDGSQPCWQGTMEEFGEFFSVSAKYLKEKFPDLKIGGPAFCYMGEGLNGITNDVKIILDIMKKNDVKLDFVSYHGYWNDVEGFKRYNDGAIEIFNSYGYEKAEKILDEWNYVQGWNGDKWIYTLKSIQGQKGASYQTAIMCVGQKSKVDMLMYYDARLFCTMNGLFNQFLEPLAGYYAIKAFDEIYKLKNCALSTDENYVYSVAGFDDNNKQILLTCFNNNESFTPKNVELNLLGVGDKDMAEIYFLDNNNGFELRARKKIKNLKIKLKNYDIVKIKIVK